MKSNSYHKKPFLNNFEANVLKCTRRATYDTSYQTLAFLPLLLEGCRQALLEKRRSIRRKNRSLSNIFSLALINRAGGLYGRILTEKIVNSFAF